MKTLAIDIETYSSVDLTKAGVYAYANAPDFKILLFAYAFDNEPVNIVDIASGEKLPEKIVKAIQSDDVIKTAFNAQFERVCLSRYLKIQLKPNSWICSAVQAAMLGLPHSLKGVAKILNLEQQKMKEGVNLIRLFSKPNRKGERNMPCDYPEKWDVFKKYCKRDVEVERAIREKIAKYPISLKEREFYILDQKINDRGINVDIQLVNQAIICDRENSEKAFNDAQKITGLENPNSVSQLKQWLCENGIETDNLSKANVSKLIQETDGNVVKVLKLRQQLSKTSIRKYEAIKMSVCSDGRVRGLLKFYGANRTGRFSSKIIQIQNLPQNHIKDLTLARNLIKEHRFEDVGLFYESTPNVLSELIRTAFIPSLYNRFIVADFSAIEARVVAWLAGETWVLDTFKKGKGIYEATAARMYNVPEDSIVKGNPNYVYRQKGKQAVLACGYSGGVGALKSMGADMAEDDMKELVYSWRNANPNIVKFWYAVERAAKKAVRDKTTVECGYVRFSYERGILFIRLPSGRNLAYIKPRLDYDDRFNRECITYEGIEQKSWTRLHTYGGKLVENITQGVARDILAEAMLSLDKAGYNIVMHCHDEVIIDTDKGSVKDVCSIITKPPDWAEGLPLSAEGYECEYYKKE